LIDYVATTVSICMPVCKILLHVRSNCSTLAHHCYNC